MWNGKIPQRLWQQTLQAALAQVGWPAIAPRGDRQYVSARALGYRSAIALQIAAGRDRPAAAIAQQIATACQDSDFQVTAAANGYLIAQWQAGAIAVWLRELTAVPLPSLPTKLSVKPASQLVPLQYANARCVTLLELAARAGWLAGRLAPATGLWQCTTPIPWLVAAQLPWQSSDWALCAQLVAVADAQQRAAVNWQRLGLALSEAVWVWQRQQPLASATRSQLGLLIAAQHVLYWLLGVCQVAPDFIL